MSKIVKNAGGSISKTTTTFQMDTDVHHKFKIALATKGHVMADVLRDKIIEYINEPIKSNNNGTNKGNGNG